MDDQLRAREVVHHGGHGSDAPAERITAGVSSNRAVGVERQRRRHPEQLEVVERLEVGAVDHGRSLRLDPDRDSRAGEHGAVVPDERHVRCAPDANEAGARACLAHAFDQCLEHVSVGKPCDRRAQTVCERRVERDHDLVGAAALACSTFLDDDRRFSFVDRVQRLGVELVRQVL